MLTPRTIQRIGAAAGLLFVAVQLATLLGPPVLVAVIADDHRLSLVGQFRAALDAYLREGGKRFDTAPDLLAFYWWLVLATALVLLAAGAFATVRTGTAYSVFVGLFLVVTIAYWALWLVGTGGFFWITEALITALIMAAFWVVAARRRQVAEL
jgi:hypothetical protein